jgi:thioredoxin reductase
LVRSSQGQERFETAEYIFDCTGTYARPNWAGDGGIPAAGEIAARQQSTYHLEDVLGAKKAAYAGKTVAVLGGGYSAATAVCDLATLALEQQATWTVWLNAGPKQPLPRVANDPLKERDKLAVKTNNLACRCDGNLEYHHGVQIDEILSHGPEKGFRISGRVLGKTQTWEVERIIANVGFRPEPTLTQELRVQEPAGEITTAEPGYFVLGAKSMGRSGEFLLRDGHAQIRKAVAMVLGNAKLDLYAKKAA